jgi:hypothetical protein
MTLLFLSPRDNLPLFCHREAKGHGDLSLLVIASPDVKSRRGDLTIFHEIAARHASLAASLRFDYRSQ